MPRVIADILRNTKTLMLTELLMIRKTRDELAGQLKSVQLILSGVLDELLYTRASAETIRLAQAAQDAGRAALRALDHEPGEETPPLKKASRRGTVDWSGK